MATGVALLTRLAALRNFGYAPPANRAGGVCYARTINREAHTLWVRASNQVLSNYVRELALTGKFAGGYGRKIIARPLLTSSTRIPNPVKLGKVLVSFTSGLRKLTNGTKQNTCAKILVITIEFEYNYACK